MVCNVSLLVYVFWVLNRGFHCGGPYDHVRTPSCMICNESIWVFITVCSLLVCFECDDDRVCLLFACLYVSRAGLTSLGTSELVIFLWWFHIHRLEWVYLLFVCVLCVPTAGLRDHGESQVVDDCHSRTVWRPPTRVSLTFVCVCSVRAHCWWSQVVDGCHSSTVWHPWTRVSLTFVCVCFVRALWFEIPWSESGRGWLPLIINGLTSLDSS